MKKLRALVLVGAIIGFIVWSNNPIDDTMNFIIGGTIPGTNIALGFWSTIGVVMLLILLVKHWISSLQQEILEQTSIQINEEKMKKEFKQTHETTDSVRRKAIFSSDELKSTSF